MPKTKNITSSNSKHEKSSKPKSLPAVKPKRQCSDPTKPMVSKLQDPQISALLGNVRPSPPPKTNVWEYRLVRQQKTLQVLKSEFEAYEKVRKSGKYNMVTQGELARQAAGLSQEIYDLIWAYYTELCNFFPLVCK